MAVICSVPPFAPVVANGMLSIYLDPAFFQSDAAFQADIARFVDWVKSSRKIDPSGEILMPGEIEERTKAQRQRDGIEIEDFTWSQIQATAASVGLAELVP